MLCSPPIGVYGFQLCHFGFARRRRGVEGGSGGVFTGFSCAISDLRTRVMLIRSLSF